MQTIETGNHQTNAGENSRSGAVPDISHPLEALGLELAIDGKMLDREGFLSAVRQAAESTGNEFLFDLPASGLTENCSRIALLRHKRADTADLFLIVKLDQAGENITVSEPDEAMQGLAEFARAFVNLLSRL